MDECKPLARGIVAELLPADLQQNAAEGGRPGAAAELSDWAAYLAAAAARPGRY